MNDDSSSIRPAHVMKRDGRVVPFEADKISRALFAASESLGQPDAFLARELTDGVVHFLAAESDNETPNTSRITDLVVKVVRELGQPALAEVFARYGQQRVRGAVSPMAMRSGESEVMLRFPSNMPLAAVLAECTRSYSLQVVFARDLVAAQTDGLLTLTGLDHPCELASCTPGLRPPWEGGSVGLASMIEGTRHLAGQTVIFDGPEHGLLRTRETDIRSFVHELNKGLRITGLSAVVNLNVASPPPWADDLAEGPLFADHRGEMTQTDRLALADALFDELRQANGVRIDWHLGPSDFLPENRYRLERVTQAALSGASIAFTFDRSRNTVALGEGVDRLHPAVLLTVGLHLPRLTAYAGVGDDPALFLQKLASLARLALSAGVQKRAFLRQQSRTRVENATDAPGVSTGFLLDRARLVVAPIGLDKVVRIFTGSNLAAGGHALDFGKKIVARLSDVLRQDGRRTLLETCLDAPTSFTLTGDLPEANMVAGLTPWEMASQRDQIRAAGPLHAAAGCGTLALFVPSENLPEPTEAADWLRLAWQRNDVVRLRFVRDSSCQHK